MINYAETFTEDRLQEIVRRIVEVADPAQIVLFGSAARGQMGPDSDADFLVVAEPGVDRIHMAQDIYRNMRGVRQPVDIVVVTTEDVQQFGDSPWLVIHPALKEGRVVYERE